MRPVDSQFIIDELLQAGPPPCKGAQHPYGCRIFQRLLEHCPPAQMEQLVECLLGDAAALSAHIYGNYVMQHLLEHGTANQIARLTEILAENAFKVGMANYGPAVLSKALERAGPQHQMALANHSWQRQNSIPPWPNHDMATSL